MMAGADSGRVTLGSCDRQRLFPLFETRGGIGQRGIKAFACWDLFPPPGTSAGRADGLPAARPDRDGVTTFHAVEPRSGWVPPLLRGRVAACRQKWDLHPSPRSPSWSTIVRRRSVTEPPRGFTRVHPSDLPLARFARMGRGRLGRYPRLRTPRLPGRTRGLGTNLDTGGAVPAARTVRPRVAPLLSLLSPLSLFSLLFSPLRHSSRAGRRFWALLPLPGHWGRSFPQPVLNG
jgi:hypothetical protein